MAERSVANRLLSLFTSPERADSIEGDLLEERQTRGRLWFVVNVATTTLALWRQAVELALLRTAAIAALAVALSCAACGSVELARAELATLWLVNVPSSLLIVAFAFLLGASLVRVAPNVGVAAIVATTLVLLAMFLYTQLDVRAEQFRGAAEGNAIVAAAGVVASLIRDLAAAAAVYLAPLNVGSVLMHERRARH